MSWTPHSLLPKTPCARCNTTSYNVPVFGDRDHAACIGKTFCSVTCEVYMHWRAHFNYFEKVEVDHEKYAIQSRKRGPRRVDS